MSELNFQLTMTGVAEVRDKDGNLKSAEPVEFTTTVTEAQAKALTEGEAQ